MGGGKSGKHRTAGLLMFFLCVLNAAAGQGSLFFHSCAFDTFRRGVGVGWGGAVGESEARVKTCQDDKKRERKNGVHFEIGFQRLLWVDADPVLLDILSLLH